MFVVESFDSSLLVWLEMLCMVVLPCVVVCVLWVGFVGLGFD